MHQVRQSVALRQHPVESTVWTCVGTPVWSPLRGAVTRRSGIGSERGKGAYIRQGVNLAARPPSPESIAWRLGRWRPRRWRNVAQLLYRFGAVRCP